MADRIVRRHYYFSGRVQGVGFRYKAMYLARGLELTGWAENLWDGRVEMEVQGEASRISRLIARLQDDRFIVIDGIEEREIPVVEERGFGVRGY